MSQSSNEPDTPEVGLVQDEDLPEDLQPSEDNPLARDPGQDEDEEGSVESPKVAGMPDVGHPG